jgi:type II secretory pathway pseudopilin PulG
VDEKDNNEAQGNEASNTPNDNEGKIQVNITNGDEAKPKEEDTPKEQSDEETDTEESDSPLPKSEEETSDAVAVENHEEGPTSGEAEQEDPVATTDDVEPEPKEEVTHEETVTQTNEADDFKPSVQPVHAAAVSPPSEVAQLKERNKHLKIWLVLFVIIIVAAASAFVVYFSQQNKNQDSTAELQAQNAQLEQQLLEKQNNATEQKIEELNNQLQGEQAKNTELTQTVQELEAEVKAVTDIANQLKQLCGDACEDVTVPTAASTADTTAN